MSSEIKIMKCGITDIKVDAIVNAANSRLAQGSGVCGYIFDEAGSFELTQACQKYNGCPTGQAVITPGFKSKAKYIIHAVGPIYDANNERLVGRQLYDAYKNSLILARENDIHSIAFPLISAGIYGYPVKDAWKTALQACLNWINKNEDYSLEINFTILSDQIIKIGNDILHSLSESSIKSEVSSSSHGNKSLVTLFEEVCREVETNPILGYETVKSRNKNRLYLDEFVAQIHVEKNEEVDIVVVDDKTLSCASKLVEDKSLKVAALNFANSKHPGGGVLKGSIAQEECMCRISNLYQCLDTNYNKRHYYYPNRDLDNLGSDAVIYTPNVTIFRTDELYSKRLEEKDWYQVNMLTCAAPRFFSKTDLPLHLVYKTQKKRIRNILEVAIDNDIDVLILGAFGCGAFNNPPQVVAQAFKDLLVEEEYGLCFKKVIFAIPKSRFPSNSNYEVFKEVLMG